MTHFLSQVQLFFLPLHNPNFFILAKAFSLVTLGSLDLVFGHLVATEHLVAISAVAIAVATITITIIVTTITVAVIVAVTVAVIVAVTVAVIVAGTLSTMTLISFIASFRVRPLVVNFLLQVILAGLFITIIL